MGWGGVAWAVEGTKSSVTGGGVAWAVEGTKSSVNGRSNLIPIKRRELKFYTLLFQVLGRYHAGQKCSE